MNGFPEKELPVMDDSGQYSITISRLNVILSKKVFGYYDIILAFVSNKVHQYQTISVIS
ncbi:hypothetical protein [Flectobacillus sp. BAB-3569]|uniref:hypothetical protein n=1 Tax=Flectobacillus sp. BAB-3569 TaxID=1509483 RepID=UPI001595E6B5|nr:hypothetical protein [Flectobacillus sp. BAB-3569]